MEENLGLNVSANTSEAAGAFDDLSGSIDKTTGAVQDNTIALEENKAAQDMAARNAAANAAAADKMAASTKAVTDSTDAATAAADKYVVTLGKGDAAITITATSMGDLTAKIDAYTASTIAAETAARQFAIAQELQASASTKYAASAVESQVAARAAASTVASDMSPLYNHLKSVSNVATPAVLKAASWGILGVGGAAYMGIKQYIALNKELTQTITQAGFSPANGGMNFLTTMAENVSKLSGVNLNDVANSIYRVASGTASWNHGLGASRKELTNITTEVAKLGVIGGVSSGANFEQASRVVVSMVNAGMSDVGKNPQKAAMLINAAVGSGDMRLGDLVPGLGRGLLQSARSNNVTAKDALAWVAALTSMGTTASVAGNYVKTGMNLLANPSAQGTTALAMMGIHPGEMQALMSGPGGLVSAVHTLVAGMHQFSPGAGFLALTKAGLNMKPGSSGFQAAVNKLESWGVGEIPKTFIADWAKGKLNAKEQTYASDLILTKAFGGSKQFATIAALTNNPALLVGIENSIGAKDNAAYLKKSETMAENTPAMRFQKDYRQIQVDLVNIGKTLYPVAIHLVDGFTKIIDVIGKFKPLLEGLATSFAAIVAMAAYGKIASIYTEHLLPLIGKGFSGYIGMSNRMSNDSFLGKIFKSNAAKLQANGGSDALRTYQMKQLESDAMLAKGLEATTVEVGRNIIAIDLNTEALGGKGSGYKGGGGGIGGAGGKVLTQEQRVAKSVEGASQYKATPFYKGANGKFVSAADAAAQGLSPSGTYYTDIATGKRAAVAADGVVGGLAKDVGGASSLLEGGVGAGIIDAGGAGLLGGALGMIGGPVGMMLMASILPMALPTIIQSVGSLFGALGRFVGGNGSKPMKITPSTILTKQAAISAQTAALNKLHGFQVYNAKTNTWSDPLTQTVNQAEHEAMARAAYIKSEQAVGHFSKNAYGAYRLSYQESQSNGLQGAINALTKESTNSVSRWSGGSVGQELTYKKIFAGLPSGVRAQIDAIMKGRTSGKGMYGQTENMGNGAFNQMLLHFLNTRKSADLSNVAYIRSLGAQIWENVLPQDYANSMGQNPGGLLTLGHGFLKAGNSGKLGFSTASAHLMNLEQAAKAMVTEDIQRMNGMTNKSAKDDMKKNAENAQKAADTLAKMLGELTKDKLLKIHPSTLSEAAHQNADALRGVYQDLGLTSTGMQNAFKGALTASGSSLVALINSANNNNRARGKKVG